MATINSCRKRLKEFAPLFCGGRTPIMSPAHLPEVKQAAVHPQILIACDDDAIAHQLQSLFHRASLDSVCTKSIATACYVARSGSFPVIFSIPSLSDGSWRQLLDVSKNWSRAPAVVVVARSFDMNEWGESLRYGAFDVLDLLVEIDRAPEVATLALLATRSAPLPNPVRDAQISLAS